ncbi:MAG: hypothetical protein Q4D85_12405 [Corynebacterium sp.]|uniref:hypothetical protein n=1 Tax=Corynebacterium sp. TaxID=1720 RepID=UPI0026DB6716|nr:hypothetical protein [Corynebacterium sp.]MDO5099536.1 hypothetical protein [Corynebacterium sp.]
MQPFKLRHNLWEIEFEAFNPAALATLNPRCELAPNADLWFITYEGCEFVFVNDLDYGPCVRFFDWSHYKLAQQLVNMLTKPTAGNQQ